MNKPKANASAEPAEPEAVTEAPAESIDAQEPEPVSEEAATNGTEEKPAEAATEEAPAPVEQKDYSVGLGASEIDAEMAKRKARAERFKIAQPTADAEATETATPDADAQKRLERAKKFGTGSTAIGKLDEALSSERPKGKGRGADESTALDDPGLKKNFGRRGRFNGRRKGGPGKPTGIGKPSNSAYSNDRDRQAADARKKRFAT